VATAMSLPSLPHQPPIHRGRLFLFRGGGASAPLRLSEDLPMEPHAPPPGVSVSVSCHRGARPFSFRSPSHPRRRGQCLRLSGSGFLERCDSEFHLLNPYHTGIGRTGCTFCGLAQREVSPPLLQFGHSFLKGFDTIHWLQSVFTRDLEIAWRGPGPSESTPDLGGVER
jgi:hypothetical protein